MNEKHILKFVPWWSGINLKYPIEPHSYRLFSDMACKHPINPNWTACSCLIWVRISEWKVFIPGQFKINSHNGLKPQLLKPVLTIGANGKTTKNLKEKLENGIFTGGFEKLYYIPENLENHIWGSSYVQEDLKRT